MSEIKGLEHLDYLDDYYKQIREYLEEDKTINFTRKGYDYLLLKFFPEEMKFEAKRKTDDKMGKLPVTSYEVEEIYYKLFKNKGESKMKKESVKNGKLEKNRVEEKEKKVPEKKEKVVEKKVQNQGDENKKLPLVKMVKTTIDSKPKHYTMETLIKYLVEDCGYVGKEKYIAKMFKSEQSWNDLLK